MSEPSFATLVQEFFLKRLINQKNASPHTVAAYKDTFRLLIGDLSKQTGKTPSSLSLWDFNAPLILKFLDYLETERNNSARSRNARFAAIRAFLRYCSYLVPEHIATIQQVLAVPLKRAQHSDVAFMSVEEMQAIIQAADIRSWNGLRDHTMFATLYNTGARVSEITALKVKDVFLGKSPSVRIMGKGRKERTMPLWNQTAELLKNWVARLDGNDSVPLFPNTKGNSMTRHGVEHRLSLAKKKAEVLCPSLKDKHVSPHTIRHTSAIHLLQAGVDITVIALWLGHEQITTTHKYLKADLAMKERVLQKLSPPHTNPVRRFKPTDPLLGFLESL
jgi:integrase/recombinase XerD